MKKIAVVFGTRPEAIKMAPLVRELKSCQSFEVFVVVTGQHRELLDQALDLFQINPDYDLDIMETNQNLERITVKVLQDLTPVLVSEKPDMILVHGDTTTTFTSALAGFYKQIPVGHIEAGLRTDDKYNPFPEELNRHLCGVLSELHFAPTEQAKNNLLNEGIAEDKIFVTGNTVIDALLEIFDPDYEFTEEVLNNLNFKEKRVILLTAHRRENIGQPLLDVCKAVKKILNQVPKVEVVFPLHPNPRVQEIVRSTLKKEDQVHLISSLNYQSFVNLMGRVDIILTDSGGIQEEAPSLGKPVLVLRETTERPEAIASGTASLVGRSQERIVKKSIELLRDEEAYLQMAHAANPYGDGKAAKRIKEILITYFGV